MRERSFKFWGAYIFYLICNTYLFPITGIAFCCSNPHDPKTTEPSSTEPSFLLQQKQHINIYSKYSQYECSMTKSQSSNSRSAGHMLLSNLFSQSFLNLLNQPKFLVSFLRKIQKLTHVCQIISDKGPLKPWCTNHSESFF